MADKLINVAMETLDALVIGGAALDAGDLTRTDVSDAIGRGILLVQLLDAAGYSIVRRDTTGAVDTTSGT